MASLQLGDVETLKGDRDRIAGCGPREIGLVVKCYSGIEDQFKVCDLVDIVGILEIPEDDTSEGAASEPALHAITIEKKQLCHMTLDGCERLSLSE